MAKIVILDDQADICVSIKARLNEDGHDVRISCVGDEAIDFCHLFQPDLLITDWRLQSEYDGVEVADAFRFANDGIKTILITGQSQLDVKKHVSNVEFHSILYKPFSLDDIARTVDKILGEEEEAECALS